MLSADYPLIAIVSRDPEKAFELKKLLRKRGIFAFIMSPIEAQRSLYKMSLLIVYTDRYSSPIYSVITHRNALYERVTVIYIGDPEHLRGECVDVIMPYKHAVFYERIFDRIVETSHGDLLYAEAPPVVTDLYERHFVLFHGVRIYLSHTESVMIHYLARAASSYATLEELAEMLDLTPGTVCFMVNSINNKALNVYHSKMVKARRFKGYYIIGREPKE